jgi:hypothetical protein
MPCRCRNDQEAALDTAIEHARSHPWGAPRTSDTGTSEIALS